MIRPDRRGDPSVGSFFLVLCCALLGACADQPEVLLLAPSEGLITDQSSVEVVGFVTGQPAAAEVRVNGTPVEVSAQGQFNAVVELDADEILNPIRVDYLDGTSQLEVVERRTVLVGSRVADGAFSNDAVALRINDPALTRIEGPVGDLVEFDPRELLPPGTTVFDRCVVRGLFGVCLGSARVRVSGPGPSISDFDLMLDAHPGFVAADVRVRNLRVDLFADGSGLVPNCPLTITVETADIFGDYALSPDPFDPTAVDVDQLPGLNVELSNFRDDLDGICDVPIIRDIIGLFLPDVRAIFDANLLAILGDPDGPGPVDAPIAESIEETLLGLDLTGDIANPLEESLGVMIEVDVADVAVDADGLTVRSDARVTSDIGLQEGQCPPTPGSPSLESSYVVQEAFPAYGPTTPGGADYDLALGLSTSVFNQILKAQTECGLLTFEQTEFTIGTFTVRTTAGSLSLLVDELRIFPPSSPLVIAVKPTVAPILTGAPGPRGEVAELLLGGLLIEIRDPTPGVELPLLGLMVDLRVGAELAFDAERSELVPTVVEPLAENLHVDVVSNLLGVNEASFVSERAPRLVELAIPEFNARLAPFPVPTLLDIGLDLVSIERSGDFLTVFANLQP